MPLPHEPAFAPAADPYPDHVLRLFRATMPGVAGVVLSSQEGQPLAHDVAADAHALARAALAQHRQDGAQGASALVPGPEGLYLVVFLAPDMAETLSPPALAVA